MNFYILFALASLLTFQCDADPIKMGNEILAGLGELCSSTDDCTTPNSYCAADNICRCKEQYIEFQNVCIEVRGIGEVCIADDQCKHGGPGEYSECREDEENPGDKICVCKPGSLENPEGKCVIGKVLIGQPCQEDSNCPDRAECYISGVCTCGTRSSQHRYVPSINLAECLEMNSLGETCKESQQCHNRRAGIHAICGPDSNGTMICKCNEASVALQDEADRYTSCYPKAKYVGDSCTFTQQCVPILGSSECIDEKCACFPGTIMSPDGTRCIQDTSNRN